MSRSSRGRLGRVHHGKESGGRPGVVQQLGRHAVCGGKVVRKRDPVDYLAPRFPGLYHIFPIDSEPDGHPDIATGASRHNLTVAFTDAGTGC